MKAKSLLRQRIPLDERSFVEMAVWEVPEPVQGSKHTFKYRLAYVVDGTCVLRFDNEAGKGDHCHIDDEERPIGFHSIRKLLDAFWTEVDNVRDGGRDESTDD